MSDPLYKERRKSQQLRRMSQASVKSQQNSKADPARKPSLKAGERPRPLKTGERQPRQQKAAPAQKPVRTKTDPRAMNHQNHNNHALPPVPRKPSKPKNDKKKSVSFSPNATQYHVDAEEERGKYGHDFFYVCVCVWGGGIYIRLEKFVNRI